MTERFDAIVIGTGQAGPSLAARMATEGWKVAVVEKGKFGGTCVNTGCTPTKTMVASARVAHMVRRAAAYGVLIEGSVTVDLDKVQDRKDGIVQEATNGVENWMKETENITVFEGHARFIENHVVEVDGEQLTADKIFINVGGRARVPTGYERVPFLTNEEIMTLRTIPEHLLIVGGSYIGLEFGQMFRRFGSKVTIVEKNNRVVGREDPDVSAEILRFLEEEGVKFRLEAECLDGIPHDRDQILINVDCETGDRKVVGSHLLLAVGRLPNTDDLGLEHTGISTDDKGFIIVDDRLETHVKGIWAVGDCNGRGGFTHTSYNDHEIVLANLFDNDTRKISDRILCYGLYTDPALARIGMSEVEAKASGRSILIGHRPMSRIARAKEKGETHGFIKILVDANSHEILGATILGIEGDEIIHSLLDIMYAKAPYTVVSRAMHIHPTVSELIPTILQNLQPLA
ncbi:MAG: FAD-containing oxidoreductase [Bacteroidota bacterium]